LFWRGAKCDDGVSTTRDARSARSCNRSPNDQGCRVSGHGAHEAANLKDQNAAQKRTLEWKVLVGFAPSRLKRGDCQKEGGAIPAHLIQRMELVGNARNGCSHDCHIESNKEYGERQRHNNHCQSERGWVLFFFAARHLAGASIGDLSL
jgi:hypothetical protein